MDGAFAPNTTTTVGDDVFAGLRLRLFTVFYHLYLRSPSLGQASFNNFRDTIGKQLVSLGTSCASTKQVEQQKLKKIESHFHFHFHFHTPLSAVHPQTRAVRSQAGPFTWWFYPASGCCLVQAAATQ
jgi:hypothetical protein